MGNESTTNESTTNVGANLVENAPVAPGTQEVPEPLKMTKGPGEVKIAMYEGDFFTLLGVVGPAVRDCDKTLLTGVMLHFREAWDIFTTPADPEREKEPLAIQQKAEHDLEVGKALYTLGGNMVESVKAHPLYADFLPICLSKMGLKSLKQWEAAKADYLEAQLNLDTANRTLGELRRANREASKAVFAKKVKSAKADGEGKPKANGFGEGWYTSRGVYVYVNASGLARLVDPAQAYVSPEFKVSSRQTINVGAHLWKIGGFEKWIADGAKNTGINCGSSSERVTDGGETEAARKRYQQEIGLSEDAARIVKERATKPA